MTLWKVAIFDFDDRLHEADTVAKHLERCLLEQEAGVVVTQYSGKGDEKTAVGTIKHLDRGGYDLILTITSDALSLALHFLKETTTLYTNVNNPLFLGFSTLEAPGKNIFNSSLSDSRHFRTSIKMSTVLLTFFSQTANRKKNFTRQVLNCELPPFLKGD